MEPGLGALVEEARGGDSRAWDQIVERFLPLVCGTIARLGLFGAEAEDVNQTVWLRLVEHLDDIREPEALPGWIAVTARRECLRTFDKGRRAMPTDPQDSPAFDSTPDPAPPLDDDLLRAEQMQALRDALDQLPEERRRLLLLLLIDPPLAYREISERLGIPVGSIGPTRARALDQLRKTPVLQAFLHTSTIEEGRDR